MVYSEEAGGLTSDPNGREIGITSEPQVVELIGNKAFSNLLTFTTEVNENLFGSYQGILLLYGEDAPAGGGYPEAYATISGTVSAGGTEYIISDLKVPLGTSGIDLNMVKSVTIDENNEAVVKVIFDVENCAFLIHNPTTPQSALIPGGGDLGVVIDNLLFSPYVGNNNPTVDKYEVVLNTNDFGDNTKWYLKVVTFIDEEGNLVGGYWQTVYKEGFVDVQPGFAPGMLYQPLLKKEADNTYSIQDNPETTFTPASLIGLNSALQISCNLRSKMIRKSNSACLFHIIPQC